MGDISEHFSRSEFSCSCGCGFEAVDFELVEILERTRAYFGGKPLHIHCACRCLEHNKSIGSKDTSQHIKGMAVDFHINDVKPIDIAWYVDRHCLPDSGGIGIYDNWHDAGVHIDVRQNRVRWSDKA